MDFQPSNLFVRDCTLFGDTGRPSSSLRCFHYFFNGWNKQWIMTPWKAKRSLVVMKPIWVTSWQYYNATEARLALSLPGPEPTHKLTLVLSNDVDVELYGPCFVAPLQRAAALADVHMGRPGNGVEYMLKGPFPLQFNYDQYSVENLK